jgi:hypothetical protein
VLLLVFSSDLSLFNPLSFNRHQSHLLPAFTVYSLPLPIHLFTAYPLPMHCRFIVYALPLHCFTADSLSIHCYALLVHCADLPRLALKEEPVLLLVLSIDHPLCKNQLSIQSQTK